MHVTDKDGLYAAFKAKDARFDGRFLVGISTTGIYCRPVCKARQPKAENCTFFKTAAQAERAGYRPCLRCRPELAPGLSINDASAKLAHRAARLIENCDGGLSLDELAGRLGCTGRHLRRVFAAEFNVTPVWYLQTCRLLLAKNLLTDTSLSVLDVAMASGFGSLRRLNDLFKKHYQLSPTQLRKNAPDNKSGSITLALGYRPPYRWEETLLFFSGRAIPGVEIVSGGEYSRTVHMQDCAGSIVRGWIRVCHMPEKNALCVTVSETLLPVLPRILAKVRHQFDLYCDPDTISETLASMNDIRPGLFTPGTRLPGSFDAFEMAVRAVLGQQITVKAARTLAQRVAAAYGTPIRTGIDGLTHTFPSYGDILALGGSVGDHLGRLGVTAARSRAIYGLAQAFESGDIVFDLCAEPESEMKKLLAIPGIGSWTARYIAMRAMQWPDAFLETDAGIKKALGSRTPKEMLKAADAWRPWRSYATISLWNSL